MLKSLINLLKSILNYTVQHIRVTGEESEYFAKYKIRDLKRVSTELKLLPDNILNFGTGV